MRVIGQEPAFAGAVSNFRVTRRHTSAELAWRHAKCKPEPASISIAQSVIDSHQVAVDIEKSWIYVTSDLYSSAIAGRRIAP